jgi:outer membrane protein OmpA-like peptidoglycan-associated protein
VNEQLVMKRLSGTLVLSLLLATSNMARQQIPDAGPGARLKVLDIVFKVEDYGSKVADLRVKETATEVRIELAADVLFEFDQATLRPAAEETLSKAADMIRDRAAGVVRIEGHTDSKGDNAYNQRLSQRRADSVRQWFVSHNLGDRKFVVSGFGETRPVAPNDKPDGADDPEGRQRNRRVEIVVAKTQ